MVSGFRGSARGVNQQLRGPLNPRMVFEEVHSALIFAVLELHYHYCSATQVRAEWPLHSQ